jgi:uncharacterized repeat protein (TIGR01451 family)
MLRRLGLATLVAVNFVTLAPAVRAAPLLRHQVTLHGDFALVGNTLAHDCAAGATPVVGTVSGCTTNGSYTDSGVDMFWVSGTSTATANNSVTLGTSARSKAMLSLPAGATVRYARLYWAAQLPTLAFDTAAQLTTPDGVAHPVAAETANSASLAITPLTGGGSWYQSSAEITGLLQALAEPRGGYVFTGGDSRNLVGLTSETTFDAWWMVVFYENAADPSLRQLTLFDGLDYVNNTGVGSTVDVTLSGFLVPSGGFDAKLGVVAYEGDAVVTGDRLFFQGYQSTGAEPTALTTLSDAQNPANNFFNGTRSWLGSAVSVAGDLPQMSGTAGSMMSFDMDVVDLKALGAIGPGHDAAKIRATSSQDVFALGAFITSINTLKPSFIETVKTATDLSGSGGILAGDVIEYTIDTRNTGNDPSIGTVLRDPLPSGVTYRPGTLQIVSGANAGTKTDAADGDQAEYDPSTRTVVVRLGSGASGTAGGSMAIGESARITFQVTIDAGASGTLHNVAAVVAGGASGEPARSFDSTPPGGAPGPTDVPIDQCLDDGACGGATPACLTSTVPKVCVGCTSSASCGGATPVCDLATHTCAGLVTLAPATQSRSTVEGAAAPFPLTLTTRVGSTDTFDLDVGDSGCGWAVEVWTAGGTLLGTKVGASGWVIAPGGDTDGDGRPDLGALPNGASADLVLRATPPAGSAGQSCTFTLGARGAASGAAASATAALSVGPAVSWAPSYTGNSAKLVLPGGSVGFPGRIQNNGSSPVDLPLSVSQSASNGATLAPWTLFTDPNGDGDPSDGVATTSTGSLAAYGGAVNVVLVLAASTSAGAALPTGTTLQATATAGAGATAATQAVEATVHHATTYADAAHLVVQSRFAPCATVSVGARGLPAGVPYLLEWYPRANPTRGADAPVRVVDPWSVSGGTGADALQLPADASGSWTVLVVEKTTPTVTVLDTIPFTVERSGAFAALTVPARIGAADGLSVAATVRSDNAVALLAGTQLAYAVTDGASFMDGAGAFGPAQASAHLTSALDLRPGERATDGWSVGAVAWPAPGVYRVDADWRVQCGGVTSVLASATASLQVAPAAPVVTSPAAGALLATRTPTLQGTALPGAAVLVSVGSASCGPALAGAGGTWSCTLGTSLADGGHTASAVQIVNGAPSDASAAVAFTVDATPPAVSLAAPVTGALLGGAAAPGRAVAVSGTAEAGATVAVSGTGAVPGAVSRAGASWSATLTFDADGVKSIAATATDAAGNTATASAVFTLDTTPPDAPVVGSPANGAWLSAADAAGGFVVVAGTAEPDAVVTVTVAGTARSAVRSGGGWAVTFQPGEGAQAVIAVATDAAGNTSAPGTSSFTLDTVAPAAPTFAAPAPGALLGGAAAPGGDVTLSGATDAGTSVTVVVDGTAHAATVAGTAWSVTVSLADGGHVASAVARDLAGNPSPAAAVTFDLDAHAPAAPALASVATPTAADPVAFSGTAEANASADVTLDGVLVATLPVGPSGAFAGTLPGLGEGSHVLAVVARDAAGNASAAAVLPFVVDRTAPAVPTVDVPADGARLGAAVAPDGLVGLGGTAEPDSAVEVEVDGLLVDVVRASALGAWTSSATLLDGPHQVRARAVDAAGNAGAWCPPVAFALDAHRPTAPVLAELASPQRGAAVIVSGTAEAGATVALALDGAAVATTAAGADGAFAFAIPVAEGTRAFVARAVDAAGNVSDPSNAVAVEVDRTAPPAPVLAALPTPSSVTSVTVSGSGTEPGAVATVVLDGTAVGTVAVAADGTFALAVAVGEGAHALTAFATDRAGNVSASAAAVALVVDRTAPGAPVLADLASPASVAAVAVSGTAVEAGSIVTVYLDGAFAGTVASGADGSFSLSVAVAEGLRTFTATAADRAGNASAPSSPVAVVVDRTPPADPVIDLLATPTGARTLAVTGTAESGAVVEVWMDGALAGTTVADGELFSLPVTVTEGTRVFTARARDGAGNASGLSAPVAVVVDWTLPVPPTLAALAGPTGATSVVVSGTTGVPGETVVLYLDDVPVATAVASDGTFTFTVAVTEGLRTFRATARDLAGNVSAPSSPVTLRVDWTAPAAPSLAALASPASITTVAVRGGGAEPGAVVSVLLDGVAVATVTAAHDGTFTAVVPVSDGLHAFVATAADAAGNVSLPSTPVALRVDTVPPAPPTLAALASPQAVATVAVAGGGAEPGSTVTVLLDGAVAGAVAAAADGTFALVVPVAEGLRTLAAFARDAAGNASGASNAVSVVVDRTAPLAPVLDVLATPQASDAVAVSGAAEVGAVVTVLVDGAFAGTTTVAADARFSLAVAVAEGLRHFTAIAADAAGNASLASAPADVTVDRTPPAAPVLGVPAAPQRGATVPVSGTAEAGAVVAVLVDGTVAGTVTAAADGTFSLDVAVGEGTLALTATATDAAGNVSAACAAVGVTVDRTPPAAPVLDLLPTPTGAATVFVTGTAESGAVVSVELDGTFVGTAVADGGTFSVPVAVAEGTRTFVARATDAAGNVSPASDPRQVVVDLTLPAPPVLAGLVTPTSAATVAVSGTAAAGAVVTLTVDGAFAGTAVAADGSFSITVALAEGPHDLRATARDAASRVSAPSNLVHVVVDRTPPGVPSLLSPVDGGRVAGPVVVLDGSAEAGSAVEVELDGVVVAVTSTASGAFAWTTPLGDGEHAVRLRAADAAGNASAWSPSSTFTVDSAAPAAPTLDPLASPTNAAAVTVSGVAEPGATVTVLLDGALAGTAAAGGDGRFSIAIPVAEGTRTFVARATDAVGNVSGDSRPAIAVVDRTAPDAPGVAALASPTSATTLVVSGTAQAGALVTVLVDGVAVATTSARDDGTWSVPAPVAEGTHGVAATAADVGGTSAPSAAVTVVVDRSAPRAPVFSSPTPGEELPAGDVVLTGIAEPGVTVRVTLGATVYTTSAAAGTGAFSVTAARLVPGAVTAVATAVDAAANVSPEARVAFAVVGDAGAAAASGQGKGGGGCGCGTGSGAGALALLPLVLSLAPRRRRVHGRGVSAT